MVPTAGLALAALKGRVGEIRGGGGGWQQIYVRSTRGQSVKRFSVVREDGKRVARAENVDGEFYVDHTCIDCDTCRWMAPDVFSRVGDQSAVVTQPHAQTTRKRAMQALIACPTHSIHMKVGAQKGELSEERMNIPTLVEGCSDIYHNGYHSESTFAAASWLITTQNNPPVMFDVPRFDAPLVKRIEQMGGLQYIVLSHRDDVGEHEKWANHFGAKRVIHKTELCNSIKDAEILLEGEGPWSLDDAYPHLKIIHTPGHTQGSIVLYHDLERVLFTGDHLAMSGHLERLTIFPRYNFYSIQKQLSSVDKLKDLDIQWILPGHGRPFKFKSKQEYNNSLKQMLKEEGYQPTP
eukprot:TRINITY_DN16148_c0_g2_i2.p1 TRINITY_DN16148_c0_g2~~TRINITY_DN16148_c0_g2_i2.p1  ORF type:complete len:350 (+),score=58.04 TRINITY_DN16148_c0_g2_i2:147-1196(+)